MEIGQTIIIIILLIIAIVLIVFLIADVEFPPPDFYTPFANGSLIRIKSLANQKYLRKATSRDYPNCTDTNWFGRTSIQVVADVDNPTNDPSTIWTLCQYAGSSGSAPTPGNNAVYTLFNGQENSEEILIFNNQVVKPLLVTPSELLGCPAFNNSYPPPSNSLSIAYFSFVLQETGAANNKGLKSSSYVIRDGVTGSFVATTTGNAGTALYSGCANPTPRINPQNCPTANNCPPIITMVNSSLVIDKISTLNYTFSVEVLPPTS